MTMNPEWILIIPAQPRKDAERAFAEWKHQQESKGIQIPDERIRIDMISMGPGGGGCDFQYWVRSSLESASGRAPRIPDA